MGSAVLLGASPLVAQQPRDSLADTARRIERIVVRAARQPATVGGTGAVVLRPDSLRGSPAPVLEEALRAMPFVLVRQNSRGEMELSVRGSDSRQAAVIVDGVPLTLGWDHRTDPSLVPLSGVQELVLVRGLSSLLHGPNVLGGIVELGIGGRAAVGTPTRAAWAATGVDHTGGYALSIGAAVPLPSPRGSLTLRAGGGFRDRRGVPLPAALRDTFATSSLRAGSDLQHADAFGSLRWNGAGGRHLGLTATGYRATRGVPPELHVASPRLWRYPHQSRALVAMSAGSGAWSTPFGLAAADVAAGLSQGRMEVESFTDARYTTVRGRELGDETTTTARAHLRHSLAGGGELRAAFTGADVRYLETLDGVSSRYRQTLWSAGSEIQLPIGPAMSMGGGAVYDAAATPLAGGRERLEALGAIGWRGGATILAGEAWRLHSSISRRSRFPALRELYSGALDRFRPNPALRPERLTGIEAGATFDAGLVAGARGAAATLQVIGFHHLLDDAVVRTTVPGSRLYVRVNRDQLRSTGAELLGTWRSSPGAAAVIVSGDLLLQRVRVHDDSAGAERRPEHQPEARGSLELGVPLGAGVRAAAGTRVTGVQYCVHPDRDVQQRLGAHAEANVSLERRWRLGRAGDALRVLLALDNVTDAVAYDQCGLPRPGRSLRVGIRLDTGR